MTRRINGLSRDVREQWLQAIGSRIRDERKRQGLSMHALAERANLSVSTIHRIEHCGGEAGLITAWRVCEALGLNLTEWAAPPAGLIARKETGDAENT